jgi:uncharacterized protein (TIGR01777 family)
MNNKTILITGGTGLVGSALTHRLLQAGHTVIVLTRHPEKQKSSHPQLTYAAWDVSAGTIDGHAIAQAHAIVHLAGAGVVDKPWTQAYKEEIVSSRVKSSELIIKALQQYPNQVEVVVSASAIGWYGADKAGHGPFVETDPPVRTFLGETCRLWEASISPVQALGKRLVICRIGIVLANEGGALPEFKKSLAFRVAGILGSGEQVVSWIHINDLCSIFMKGITDPGMQGVYNAVAPHPVTNRQLNLSLAKAMFGKGFIALPVPSFVLKLMMGDRSIEVLKSTLVSAAKIESTGFNFAFPDIEAAVADLVNQ